MSLEKGKFNEERQEIDIGKNPYGYFLEFNGERLETKEHLKDILARLESELKKAFGIEEQKRKRLFGRK